METSAQYCPRCGEASWQLNNRRQMRTSCLSAFMVSVGMLIFGAAFCGGMIGSLPFLVIGAVVGVLFTMGASIMLRKIKDRDDLIDAEERSARRRGFGEPHQ